MKQLKLTKVENDYYNRGLAQRVSYIFDRAKNSIKELEVDVLKDESVQVLMWKANSNHFGYVSLDFNNIYKANEYLRFMFDLEVEVIK